MWKPGRQEQQVCLLGAMMVPSSTSAWPGISTGSVRYVFLSFLAW